MTQTDTALRVLANQIYNETGISANTCVRVGTILLALIDSKPTVLNIVNVTVSGGTITLDDNSFFDVIFQSTGNITGNKTIAFTDTNSKKKQFLLTVAGGTYILTWPSNVKFPSSLYGWNPSTYTLPLDAGDYLITFIYDSLNSVWKGTVINY